MWNIEIKPSCLLIYTRIVGNLLSTWTSSTSHRKTLIFPSGKFSRADQTYLSREQKLSVSDRRTEKSFRIMLPTTDSSSIEIELHSASCNHRIVLRATKFLVRRSGNGKRGESVVGKKERGVVISPVRNTRFYSRPAKDIALPLEKHVKIQI